MEQILNKFLVMQKTVNIKGEQHKSQPIPKRFSEDPVGPNQTYRCLFFFFFSIYFKVLGIRLTV